VNLAAVEIKAFGPALDMTRSLDFYRALGFEVPWSSEDLAYVRHGETSFLLQRFPHLKFAQNFQMHLLVENVDDWYAQVLASGVVERFATRLEAPRDQPWAMRDFPLFDPAGVLWRIAQNLPRDLAAR
jgi:catechol 2,3-dioxygenase-like lactoylglutathione lyase family enzyme